MSDRKHTPDVLAAILNGEVPTPSEFDAEALARATPPPRVKSQSKRAAPEEAVRPEKSAGAAKPAAAARPKPIPSARWTYQVVSFQEHHGWRMRFIDGQEVKNWTEALSLQEKLAQMGEEGWELVSACSGEAMFGRADKFQLFFKQAAKSG
jgi:hypothetical protein